MNKANKIAKRNITRAIKWARRAINAELAQQGHRASGKTEGSSYVTVQGNLEVGFIAHVWHQDHVAILDKGVKPSRVPYSRGSGAKTSKYIDALIDWIGIIKPSMNKREAKSFAFAIARTAKREGHPTNGSYRFSKNGRRKNWSEHAMKDDDLNAQINFSEIADAVVFDIAQSYDQLQNVIR